MMILTGGKGSAKKDTRKVLVLAVLFVVVLGAYLVSRSREVVNNPNVKQVFDSIPPSNSSVGVQITQADTGSAETPAEGLVEEVAAEPAVSVPADTGGMSDGIPAPEQTIRDRELAIEKQYLHTLLQTVHRMPHAKLSALASQPQFSAYFEDPELWRGKVITVTGRIKRLVKRKGENPPEGLAAVYEAQVMDPNALWHYVFIPQKPSFGTNDLVKFDGVFMKVHAYENRKGTVTLAPLFVVKDFVKHEILKSDLHQNVGIAALVAIVICSVFAVLVVNNQRKQSETIARSIEDKRLAKVRKRVQSQSSSDNPSEASGKEERNEKE